MVNAKKAVIFDLDGTLVDTAPDLIAELKRVMAARGIKMPNNEAGGDSGGDMRNLIGGGALNLIRAGFASIGQELSGAALAELEKDFLQGYMQNCTKHSKPYPNSVSVLERLFSARVPLSVCTNKRQEVAEKVLHELNLTRFFRHIAGRRDDVAHKPEVAMLDEICAALNLSAEQCVMVGDSKTDIDFARNCGMPVIAVSFGYSAEPIETLGADILIDNWSELPAALEKLSLSV